MSDGAVAVMNGEGAGKAPPAVDVDVAACTVRLFLPGFDKQEVKLQQWKGGAELLVEAGDQRRCVELPRAVQGKGLLLCLSLFFWQHNESKQAGFSPASAVYPPTVFHPA
ncbi:unnamed protein product [Closterium sp. NIES-54]